MGCKSIRQVETINQKGYMIDSVPFRMKGPAISCYKQWGI